MRNEHLLIDSLFKCGFLFLALVAQQKSFAVAYPISWLATLSSEENVAGLRRGAKQ